MPAPRAHRHDVTVIGSGEAKGRALERPNLRFVRADLSEIGEVDRVVAELTGRHERVDGLALFANRPRPRRQMTADGLEYTFALYYLSRYRLGERLSPLLDASPDPVIVNVAGVGTTAGRIHWDDPQLTHGYGLVRAQLQAGRANDLLGVAHEGKARYVLYHPGFTRSGLDGHPNPLVRAALKALARVAARKVDDSAAPVVEWLQHPPTDKLTAADRGRPVEQSVHTLDPHDATRLATYTEQLLLRLPAR
ncbi:MAG: short-chain dehydrogenase [Actinophytocola sp.]|uniref:short-chain dehydrogenase n=1 Tax=Actinophytocola sp. TaxID=1872138 RepID=UPI001325689E|nr:short-chain dehydrogenase [Actinophytocola sp.]MPZ84496.1 short-chain dehydrogenase [Actinophytocola sp.]